MVEWKENEVEVVIALSAQLYVGGGIASGEVVRFE